MKTFREAFKVVPREPTGDIAVPTCPLSGVVVTVTVAWSLDSPLQGLMRTERKKLVVTEWWVEEEGAGGWRSAGGGGGGVSEWSSHPARADIPGDRKPCWPAVCSLRPPSSSFYPPHTYISMYVCMYFISSSSINTDLVCFIR